MNRPGKRHVGIHNANNPACHSPDETARFQKLGKFHRTVTSDTALYRRGDLELRLSWSIHGYDYPEIGIRMLVRDATGLLFNRLFPPEEGGIEAMLRAVVRRN